MARRRKALGSAASVHIERQARAYGSVRAELREARKALDKGDCARAFQGITGAAQWFGQVNAEARGGDRNPTEGRSALDRQTDDAYQFAKDRFKATCLLKKG